MIFFFESPVADFDFIELPHTLVMIIYLAILAFKFILLSCI